MMSMTNNNNTKIKRTSAISSSSYSKEAAVTTTTTMTKPIKSSTTAKSSFRLKLSIPKSMKKKKEKKQSNNGVAAVVTGNEYKIQNVAVISPKSLTTIPSSEDVDDHNHHETTTTGSRNNDASTTARSNDDVKVEGDEFNLADDQSLLLETDDNDEDVQSMAEWSGQIKMVDDDDDTCVSGSSESILSSSVQQKRGSIQLRPKKRGSKLLPPSMNDDDDDDDEDNEFLMLHDELHSSRHGDPEHKKKQDKENNKVQPRYEMMGDVYVRSDSALSISSSSNTKHNNKPTTTANNHQTDLIKSKLNILTGSSTTTTTTEIKGATMNDNNNDENDDEQSGMRTPSIATQSEAGDDNVEEEVHIEGETPVRHKGIQVHDDEDDHLLNTSLRGQMFTIEGLRQQAKKTKDELPQSLEMNITNSDETEAVQPTTNITTTSTIRMKILLLSPEHRKFELIKVKCTQDTSVDDVLTKLIPTTTSDPLFNKTLTYKSLCRVTSLSKNLGSSPSCASKSSSHSRGSKENNTSPSGSCSMEVFVNAFPLEVYDIRSKHYLIAIPSDDKWSVGDVADMGYAILQQAKQAKKQDRLLGAVGSPDSRSSGSSGQKSLNLSSTDIMAPIDEMTTLTEEKIVPTTILEASSFTDVVATTKTTTTSFWSNLFKFVLKMIGIWCLLMSFVALIAEDLRLRTPLGVGDVMEVGELKNKCGLLDIFLPTNTLRQMLGIELCPEGPSATLELVTYQSEGEMTNMALIYYEDSKPIWEMIPSSTSSSSSSWFKHSTKSTVSSDDTNTLTIDPKGHVWMGGSPAKLVLQNNNKGNKHSSSKNNIRLSPWPFEQEPIGLAMH